MVSRDVLSPRDRGVIHTFHGNHDATLIRFEYQDPRKVEELSWVRLGWFCNIPWANTRHILGVSSIRNVSGWRRQFFHGVETIGDAGGNVLGLPGLTALERTPVVPPIDPGHCFEPHARRSIATHVYAFIQNWWKHTFTVDLWTYPGDTCIKFAHPCIGDRVSSIKVWLHVDYRSFVEFDVYWV